MSALFSPITLRGLTLPNRIVVSPMCQYSSDDGAANDWHLIHLGGLARSGAGMLCIEATAVEPEGRITPSDLGLYDDRTEAALRSVLAAVRKYSRIPVAMQLAHAGRKASSHVPWQGGQLIAQAEGGWLPVAPSAVPQHEHEPPPAELDAAGLARIREAFVATAKRAVGLGIDALEIHNAHGYLLHEFLSPISNRRTDEYGGTLENRLRFPLAVFEAVRAAVPADMPVGVRVSGTDWVEGGWDIEQACVFAAALKKLGVDWIDASSGGVSPAQRIPARPGLSGAVGSGDQGGDRRAHDRGRPDHRSRSRPRRSSPRARPIWWRSPAACCSTRAGPGTPQHSSVPVCPHRRSTGEPHRTGTRTCSPRRPSARADRPWPAPRTRLPRASPRFTGWRSGRSPSVPRAS